MVDVPEIDTFIEYNGQQHYEPVRFNGMSESSAESIFFGLQQIRDNRVDEYINDVLNSNLFVIRYTRSKKI